MSEIEFFPLNKLGYDFIPSKYIPVNQNQNYKRDLQHEKVFGASRTYKKLSEEQIAVLEKNNNISNNWEDVWVTDGFDPRLVKNCQFYGQVRIGKLEPLFLHHRNLQLNIGLYNSTICACDIGDNVVIKNVGFMANYIIDHEVLITDVNELTVSSTAKFGNGIVKDGENERLRVWLEICNENTGRKVLPFEGMLPGDAFLWSKYRKDIALLDKFQEFTEKKFNSDRGYYGVIGKKCVIKYCKTIKDVKIGAGAYIKGANKLKNLTINSSVDDKTQIGEGCELVNGIIGYGCRIFYGVKAVRFITAPHSNLKYGARLINSYLGSNATISCCEVLNSLIFPSHEQHHNNSFLCAALIMGQSNLAAGATIGSNHNSRAADGELIAKRGFWPGLSVSLKHNSKFGSFSLIAKGDYPFEIHLPFPFTLVIHDFSSDRLIVMPGYWFMYNMYALARNVWKLAHRDQRKVKTHHLEFEYLAPDTVEEMFDGMQILAKYTGKAALLEKGIPAEESLWISTGKDLLQNHPEKVKNLDIHIDGIENSNRRTKLIKAEKAYQVFEKMILFYAVKEIIKAYQSNLFLNFEELKSLFISKDSEQWVNVGGQLIPKEKLENLKCDIKNGQVNSWDEVHEQYVQFGLAYDSDKFNHALSALMRVKNIDPTHISRDFLAKCTEEFAQTSHWIFNQIKVSREKDYTSSFRKMVYDDQEEMEEVIGKFSEDHFIEISKKQSEKESYLAEQFLHFLEQK